MKTIKVKQKEAYSSLVDEFSYENQHEAPQVKKVVVTSGIGSITDGDKIDLIRDRLAKITGQKPVATAAKHSIASFNIREGDIVGYKVTLRGKEMRAFLDKLIHLTLPRTKDFRGLDTSGIDEMGNFSLGIEEHTAFPETSDEELDDVFGLGITVVTSADSRDEAAGYLRHLGFPFKDDESASESN